MSIYMKEDHVGPGGGNYGGGYGGGGGHGLYLLAILLVFFVVVAGLWGNKHHGGEGYGYGGHHGHGCDSNCADKAFLNRVANFENPADARIEKEIACGIGQLKTQAAVDTGAIIHNNDVQTLEIEKCIGRVIENQNRLALEAERMFTAAQLAEKNAQIAALGGQLNKQEIINNNDRQSCLLSHRLDTIECKMSKEPPLWAHSFSPFSTPVGTPFPFAERGRENNCCC